jgi:hypothetical protein
MRGWFNDDIVDDDIDGRNYVIELRPPTGLLFIPQVKI